MYRIGVVTGTRAEYGLLKPLLQKIKEDDLLDLYLIVTGAHLEQRFGKNKRLTHVLYYPPIFSPVIDNLLLFLPPDF